MLQKSVSTFLYSLFVRYFLALSGFIVFIFSASVYGAEGRGVISYGMSLFAVASLIFSGNLGRSFLAETKRNDFAKKSLLVGYLKLNIVFAIAAALVGILYWLLFPSAQRILSWHQVLCFSGSSLFFIWYVNGYSFFASFSLSHKQESIILATRLLLIVLLSVLYFCDIKDFDIFIFGYILILSGGAFYEIVYLYKTIESESNSNNQSLYLIFKNIFIYHIDYLSFNLLYYLLPLFAASYLEKKELGVLNFSLQMIQLVFLLSQTAHIRITNYISNFGFHSKVPQIRKLLWVTFAASLAMSSLIYLSLESSLFQDYFPQFYGVHALFLINSFSIPGYLLYQFFSPIWVDLDKKKQVAQLLGIGFMLTLAVSPILFSGFYIEGSALVFSFFHIFLIGAQIFLIHKNFGFSFLVPAIGKIPQEQPGTNT